MNKIQRLMKLHRLMDAAGDSGSDGGGTDTGKKAGDDAGKTGDAGDDGKGSGDDDGKAAGGDAGTKPSDAEAKLLRDVMKHKTRATSLEGELAVIQGKLKAFEGLDPERIRALMAEQEALETKKLEAKGEYDRLLKQMGERHTAEKGTLEEKLRERDTKVSELSRQIADMTVGTAFAQSKFVQDLTLTPAKARVIYGGHFEFQDGAVVGYDKPAGASERTLLVNAAGDALSFDEALQKLVEADPDKDHLLRSKMKAGSGSATQTKVAKKLEDSSKPALKGTDRIALGLASMKAAAKK